EVRATDDLEAVQRGAAGSLHGAAHDFNRDRDADRRRRPSPVVRVRPTVDLDGMARRVAGLAVRGLAAVPELLRDQVGRATAGGSRMSAAAKIDLDAARTYIVAVEAAAALGLSPWNDPIGLAMEKWGEREPKAASFRM